MLNLHLLSFFASSDIRLSLVCTAFPILYQGRVSLFRYVLTSVPSSELYCSQQALPCLHLYYELIRLPSHHPGFLSFRSSASILQLKKICRISQVPTHSIRYHTTVTDPGGDIRIRQFYNTDTIVFQHMNTVDLPRP